MVVWVQWTPAPGAWILVLKAAKRGGMGAVVWIGPRCAVVAGLGAPDLAAECG